VTVGRTGRNPAAPRLDAAELQERRNKKKKVYLLVIVTLMFCQYTRSLLSRKGKVEIYSW